jgi:hypothetical protein
MSGKNPRTFIRRAALTVGATSAVLAPAACGDDDDAGPATDDGGPVTTSAAATAAFGVEDNTEVTTREYVGSIEGTEIYAAFVVSRFDDGGALEGGQAYFCDGKGVANWFRLVNPDDGLTFVAAGGASFEATESEDGTLSATVTLDGTAHDVTVTEVDADGDAGLYLADHTIDADLANDERGGWIVLPDGTQRGAIRAGTTILPGTNITDGTNNVVVAGRDILLRAITHIIGLDQQS